MNINRLRSAVAALALMTVVSAHAAGDPVLVSYTLTGTSGAYDLDFTFANNTGNSLMGIYFMGVDIPTASGSPVGFHTSSSWNPYSFEGAGPNFNYPTTWIDGNIADGNSLSGFTVHSTSLTAPTSVNWFAYGYDGTSSYDGHGSFSIPNRQAWNPGFAGTVTAQAVPEPGSLVALGLGGLALLKRRKK